jgi:predicted DNA-binding transcriptional regulator AlpA
MAESELLTLSEVSKRTGISMPTLQRYKKEYQSRIPSEGKGRKQRYPVSALPVFEEIKQENVARRGRPRKSGSGKGRAAGRPKATGSRKTRKTRKAAASGAESQGKDNLLTLTEIGNRTGISYPTLSRYVKQHLKEIPHEGKGRARRYYPEAVEVFNRLRGESRRGGGRKARGGRKAGGRRAAAGGGASSSVAAAAADGNLSRRVQSLEKAVQDLAKLIRKPMTAKVTLERR